MSSLYGTQAQFFRGKKCYITIKRPTNRVRPWMDDSTTPFTKHKHLKGYFLQIELNLDLQMRRKRSHNAAVSIHYQI